MGEGPRSGSFLFGHGEQRWTTLIDLQTYRPFAGPLRLIYKGPR